MTHIKLLNRSSSFSLKFLPRTLTVLQTMLNFNRGFVEKKDLKIKSLWLRSLNEITRIQDQAIKSKYGTFGWYLCVLSGKGNVTLSAEFNFHSDPEAAHIVLNRFSCRILLVTWELSVNSSLEWVSDSCRYCEQLNKFL